MIFNEFSGIIFHKTNIFKSDESFIAWIFISSINIFPFLTRKISPLLEILSKYRRRHEPQQNRHYSTEMKLKVWFFWFSVFRIKWENKFYEPKAFTCRSIVLYFIELLVPFFLSPIFQTVKLFVTYLNSSRDKQIFLLLFHFTLITSLLGWTLKFRIHQKFEG